MKLKTLKQIICLCLCTSIPACTGVANATESDWCQVKELQETAKEGWHQTYETQWRTVQVDVDIDVPDVETFPIIKVERMQPLDVSTLTIENLNVKVNQLGDFYAEVGDFPQSSAKNAAFKSEQDFGSSIPNYLPENNKTTYQEALDVIDKVLWGLCGQSIEDIYIKNTQVISRYYKYKIVDGEKVWLDPMNDRGFYQFTGQQLLHGITNEYCGNYTTDGKSPAVGDISISIADSNTWRVHLGWLKETGILYNDVPILSFEKAKAAYEDLIYKGFVRDVLEVRLCYAAYIDPNDSEVFYLFPVWYARCIYAKEADMEFPIYTDPSTGEVYTDNPQYEELVYEAQKGELMNWDDSSRDRRDVPQIITWDEVE